MEKRRNCSSGAISPLFHNIFSISLTQYFQYISNVRSQITYSFVKSGCLIYVFLNLQFWYIEVWISQSISESPLDFEIMRVNCICMPLLSRTMLLNSSYFILCIFRGVHLSVWQILMQRKCPFDGTMSSALNLCNQMLMCLVKSLRPAVIAVLEKF